MLSIRTATDLDLDGLDGIAVAMHARHEAGYFGRCLAEQRDGKRVLAVAEQAGRLVGYVQLIWLPLYPPFRRLAIPEIQDLNVIPEARRQGIGGRLVDFCEAQAKSTGKKEIGIGVGLHAGFGAAQRLYVQKGYVPDGAGACYDETAVRACEMRAVDDLLTLKMTKGL